MAAGVELDEVGACVAVLSVEPELADEEGLLFVDEEPVLELLAEELDEPLAVADPVELVPTPVEAPVDFLAVLLELFLTRAVERVDAVARA